MKKYIICLALFMLSNLAISDTKPDSDKNENIPTGIGLKPGNLITADLYGCCSSYLFASLEGDSPAEEPNLGSCVLGKLSLRVKKPKNSWVVTEPLGGILGGALGALAGCGLGAIFLIFLDEDATYGEGFDNSNLTAGQAGAIYGTIIGYVIGNPFGVWTTGKLIEREKGSLARTILGGLLGGVGAMILCNTNVDGVVKTVSVLTLPFAGGLIGYRLSLKK